MKNFGRQGVFDKAEYMKLDQRKALTEVEQAHLIRSIERLNS